MGGRLTYGTLLRIDVTPGAKGVTIFLPGALSQNEFARISSDWIS